MAICRSRSLSALTNILQTTLAMQRKGHFQISGTFKASPPMNVSSSRRRTTFPIQFRTLPFSPIHTTAGADYPQAGKMKIGFLAGVSFHRDPDLLIWRPRGILDEPHVEKIIATLERAEIEADRPFNRSLRREEQRSELQHQ